MNVTYKESVFLIFAAGYLVGKECLSWLTMKHSAGTQVLAYMSPLCKEILVYPSFLTMTSSVAFRNIWTRSFEIYYGHLILLVRHCILRGQCHHPQATIRFPETRRGHMDCEHQTWKLVFSCRVDSIWMRFPQIMEWGNGWVWVDGRAREVMTNPSSQWLYLRWGHVLAWTQAWMDPGSWVDLFEIYSRYGWT